MKSADTAPSVMFRVISIALLLWGLGGAAIYVAYFVEAPEQFARTAETAANRQAYADYIANIPFWAISVAIIAAASRLLGAIGLLLRRAWSLPLYIVSVIFFLATLIRAFVFADVTRVMSAAHLAIEGVFLGLGIFAVWFARESKSRGILN